MPKDNEAPSFPFYPDDFVSDGKVEAMTTEEVGAYILLLCKAWREKPAGSIPNDDRVLARWTRISPDRWAEIKAVVLCPFQLCQGGARYAQPRMQKEYAKMLDRRRFNHKRATAASNARWGDASSNAKAPSKHGPSNALPSTAPPTGPIPIPKKEKSAASPPSGENPSGGTGGKSPQGKVPRTPPTGPHAEVIGYFVEAWGKRNHADIPYPFKAKDGVIVANMLKDCGGDVPRAKSIIDRFMNDSDTFLGDHPLSMLVNRVSKYIAMTSPQHFTPRFIAGYLPPRS